MQVKAELQDVLRKMLPGESAAAYSEYCSCLNGEGVLGSPEEMVRAQDGHPRRVPTYQYWNLQGEDSAATMHDKMSA